MNSAKDLVNLLRKHDLEDSATPEECADALEEQARRIAELEAEVARLSGELSLANRTGDHLGMRVRDLKAEAEKLRTDAERY